MKNFFVVALSFVVAFSAFGKSTEDEGGVARAKFESIYLGVFKGRVAKPAEAVGDELRYDKAKGKGKWRFMLQVSTDDRVRFIDADFESGLFVSGELYVYGLGVHVLKKEEFAELKENFHMAVSRLDSKTSSLVAIHRANKKPLECIVGREELRNFTLSPIKYLWGVLPDVVKQRGVKTSSLACKVDFVSKDGVCGTLGEFFNAKKKDRLDSRALHRELVKIFAASGADASKITMRKAVDLYIGGRLIYTPHD